MQSTNWNNKLPHYRKMEAHNCIDSNSRRHLWSIYLLSHWLGSRRARLPFSSWDCCLSFGLEASH